MAVTFETSPAEYTPSDNPTFWRFSSDQTGQTNFSYIVELYIDGALDSNHQVFPEVGIYAHFDAIEQLLAQTPAPNVGQSEIIADAQNNRTVYIKVFERYGVPEVNQASATSATIYSFKANLTDPEREIWDPLKYTVGNSARLFLTRNTDTLLIQEAFDYYLTIISNDVAALELDVELFDDTGASITSVVIAWPSTYKITQILINTTLLISDTAITQANIDNTDTIQIKVYKAADFSVTKTIQIDRICGHRGAHLAWLNSMGGFDVFNFHHNLSESSKVETHSYKKQFGQWNGTDYVLDAGDSGVINYLKTATDSLEISSEWLTQSVQNWLARSVFEGVAVKIQESSTSYTRIDVVGNSYQLEQDFFTELFNVVIAVRKANERQSAKI